MRHVQVHLLTYLLISHLLTESREQRPQRSERKSAKRKSHGGPRSAKGESDEADEPGKYEIPSPEDNYEYIETPEPTGYQKIEMESR